MPTAWNRVSLVLVVQSAGIGVAAAAVAAAFRRLVAWCTLLVTGATSYGQFGRAPSTRWPWLGCWFLLAMPVAGAIVYGPLTALLTRQTATRRVREATYQLTPGTDANVRAPLVNAVAAVLCIGTGGSVGRTGPVIALCAAAGARLARATGTNPARMRLLVAAGAAGGLAASYNAPLGGACFALEVVLHTVAADAFAAVLPAALTAAAVGRALTGDTRLFALPDFPVPGAGNYLLYAVTGLAGGVLGATFSATLRRTVHSCDALWHNRPAWARPIVGGVFLGAVLLALPPLYGVGIPAITAGVQGRYTLAMLLALMAGKILATSLTFGIGGYGGVFMPTLFIGAMGGSAIGLAVHQYLPGIPGSPSHYALLGMSAAFIGATRAPVTGIVMLLELTGDYDIVVPLLVAAVPALLASTLLAPDAPYIGAVLRRMPAT